MKIIDLPRDLLRQCWLGNGIAVVFEFFLMVMEHLGYDHVLAVCRNRLFAAVTCQLPNLSDQRGRGKDLQIKEALIPAPVYDFRFAGQRKGFRNENNGISRVIDFLNKAGNQPWRSCGDDSDACHSLASCFKSCVVPSGMIRI